MFYKVILNSWVTLLEVLHKYFDRYSRFFNPAEKIGLKPHKEDVGQTLGSYGIGPDVILFYHFLVPLLQGTPLDF